MERSVILGTAGHIDHGKTALVRALTGVDTDRLPEEKKRGITIDLGFAPLEIEGVGTIGVVDVPGHEAFVRTMLAGASGIDLALLVVAADEGVMPQTREHLEILSLLGIPRGVVAITKRDLVDAEWLSLVMDDVRQLVSGTALERADLIPVSVVSGEGIPELRSAIARTAQSIANRSSEDLFRMPIDRAFSVKGTGTVVTGTVWSGSISSDSTVIIQPGGKRVRVRGIEEHGRPVASARSGSRAAIALAGCEVDDAARGMTLIAEKTWNPSRELEVTLSFTAPDFSFTPRTRFRFHLGTADTGGRLSHARFVDGEIVARMILEEAIVARSGDRFVIRIPSPAATVGGGEVVDPLPQSWRKAKTANEVSGIENWNAQNRLHRILEMEAEQGVELDVLPVRAGLRPAEIVAALTTASAIVVKDRAVSRHAIEALESNFTNALTIGIANHPLAGGVSLEQLRASMHAPSAVMDYVVNRLLEKGVIEVDGAVVRPRGWVFRLGAREQELTNAILHDICVQPVEPPSVAELSKKFGGDTVALLRRMEREGTVERVSDDRYYGRAAVAGMVETLRTRMERGREYTPAELKDVLGVSRKYLIPFLEFCDRRGFTVRNDRGRTLGEQAGG